VWVICFSKAAIVNASKLTKIPRDSGIIEIYFEKNLQIYKKGLKNA